MNNTDINLYRFRDRLCLTTDRSETEHLTIDQVKSLNEKLELFLKDIEDNPSFPDSKFAKVDITYDCGRY